MSAPWIRATTSCAIGYTGEGKNHLTVRWQIRYTLDTDAAHTISRPARIGGRKEKDMVRVYEDNGGGLHAVVFQDERVANIMSGFEDGTLSTAEFVAAARCGFAEADEYEAENYSGLPIDDAAAEIAARDDLIAEITDTHIALNADKMGIAGEILFGLHIS